jgi:hypothetical protein
VYHVRGLAGVLALAGMHVWSSETVTARFDYRSPGLYVLPVRVFRAAAVHELQETADYAGCRTWVELEQELPTDGATPVLADEEYRAVLGDLEDRLRPTAWV